MRKTRINPKLVAATLAMMTIINTAAPTIAYAAEGDTEVKVEQQIEKSESHTHEISGLDNEAPVNVTPKAESKNEEKSHDEKDQIMEYKDRFGYVYATQDLSMKKITANELEVGGRYVVKGHFSDAFTAETREIFVVGFRTEKTVWTKMFGWAGATKRIRSLDCKYIDPETGLLKWCRICLDNGDVIEARVKSGPIQMKNGADLATKLDYECMI